MWFRWMVGGVAGEVWRQTEWLRSVTRVIQAISTKTSLVPLLARCSKARYEISNFKIHIYI